MKMKRLMWGCIVIVATGLLAGCGSGGGTSLMVDGQRATQALIDALAADAKTANDALAAVRTALDVDDNADIQGAITSLETQVMEANKKLMDAEAELGSASTGDLIADIKALYMEAGTSKATLGELKNALGADSTSEADLTAAVTNLETMRDNYKKMVDDAKTAVAAALGDAATGDLAADVKALGDAYLKAADDRTKAAKADRIDRSESVRTAISSSRVSFSETPNTDATRFPGTNSGVTARNAVEASANSATQFGITRKTGGMITVDVNGTDNDDKYTGGKFSAGSGDWNGMVLTKSNNDAAESTDTLSIFTDIDDPADKKFIDQYTDRSDMLDDAAETKKAMSDHFPSGISNQRSYAGTTGNSGTFRGTFDGVPGVFSCGDSDTSCTLSTNAKGQLNTSGSDTWSFTPDAPNTATVKDPDIGYAWFGWWLNKPKDPEGTHTVEVFAGGTNQVTTIPVTLEGDAEYSGKAAGQYVTKTFSAGVQTDASVGDFIAHANLTAKFGNDSALGNISGNITNFVLDNTKSVSWKVKLESTALNANGTFNNGWTEADFGGGLSDTNATDPANPSDTDPAGIGKWQGSFYGSAASTISLDKQYPDSVAGTFDAATSDNNATVIGGFGASVTR